MSKGAALLSPPDVAACARRLRFEELYNAHHVSLLAYALRRTANTDDAADVLAETFLTAWRRLDELPGGDQARLWLYGAARRTLANHHRGQRRRLALADRLKADLAVSYRPADPDRRAASSSACRSRPRWRSRDWSRPQPGRLASMSARSPVGPARAQAAAMTVTRHGRYLDIVVRNPVADPEKYRAEFARYHLSITLKLVPASPSVVGTLVAESLSAGSGSRLKVITAVGRCFTGGGGSVCPVGIRVPVSYRGTAMLVFARAARPGEQYESAGVVTAPGEAMHGLDFAGKTAAQVEAMLARRGVTVAPWRVQRGDQCYTESRRSVPGSWRVYQAVPWAPGQVLLWAGKTLPVPACRFPRPGPASQCWPGPAGQCRGRTSRAAGIATMAADTTTISASAALPSPGAGRSSLTTRAATSHSSVR